MLFRQFQDIGHGCASYLIGCVREQVAAVIDPLSALGAQTYLLAAADLGLEIKIVVDTHIHADHLSLGRELAEATGADYCLYESARDLVTFPFRPVADGEELPVGKIRLRAVHTPGHTPESMCLVVTDGGRDDRPWFVLTGDTLMVGDVGRPDLVMGDRSLDVMDVRERAEHLYESIHGRLLSLPDYVEIFPGHFGGSSCGGVNMSGKAVSSIGFERLANLALQRSGSQEFADFVVQGLKPQPQAFQQIKLANLGRAMPDGPAVAAPDRTEAVSHEPGVRAQAGPLTPERARALISDGALLLDLRRTDQFAAEHAAGAINLQFHQSTMPERAQLFLAPGEKLVLLAEPEAVARPAAELLQGAGCHVLGWIDGGLAAWKAAGGQTGQLPLLNVADLQSRLTNGGIEILDVRDDHEYRFGHIAGAAHMPWPQVWSRWSELPADRPLVLTCATQNRSAIAASILLRQGYCNLSLLMGGMTAWTEAGGPTAKA